MIKLEVYRSVFINSCGVLSAKMFLLVKGALFFMAAVAASSHSLGPTDVVFHLFTRNNPTRSEALLPNANSIMTSSFSTSSRTVITIHSFNESVSGNFNAFLVRDELAVDDVNLLAVDWSAGSSMYSEGLSQAPQCGKVIADFINIFSSNFGYQPENFKIVGHGLGGHIAGIAARNVNGIVPHIVALDPSFHGWTHNPERLNADDAGVVEVLHTTAGIIGYDNPLGDVDFYANGGSYQPGCSIDVACSHIYSYVYYAESLRASQDGGLEFVGTQCDSYDDAINLRCNGPTDSTFGGAEIKDFDFGIYSFQTNSAPPFARG